MEINLVNKSRKELHKIIKEYQNQIDLKNEKLEKTVNVLNTYKKKIENLHRKEKDSYLKIEELEDSLKKATAYKSDAQIFQEEVIKLLSNIENLNNLKNERIKNLENEIIELTKQLDELTKKHSPILVGKEKRKNTQLFNWIKSWVYKSPKIKKVYRILFVK
ncbi:hypothetical protein NGC25_12155 [Enterococcus faecalis]|uniref:coiled-coil domain-containing protein n=1 Tax=Enterococcus faecalis TaxID=1351 RepID=UPI001386BBAF|nr:hypothetical protein [Enterococcus faecalis]MEB7428030.1 hypothetical protein [Enterococcus faecalis]